MADITDPVVIAFQNVYLRPLAEITVDLKTALDEAKTEWTQNVAPLVSGNLDSDPVVDGRLSEGVTQTTKEDLDEIIAMFSALLTALDANTTHGTPITRAALRSIFTVRPSGSRFTLG